MWGVPNGRLVMPGPIMGDWPGRCGAGDIQALAAHNEGLEIRVRGLEIRIRANVCGRCMVGEGSGQVER